MTILPNGVYRITQWGSHGQTHILTLHDGQVTVFPPGQVPEKEQEVRHLFLMRISPYQRL